MKFVKLFCVLTFLFFTLVGCIGVSASDDELDETIETDGITVDEEVEDEIVEIDGINSFAEVMGGDFNLTSVERRVIGEDSLFAGVIAEMHIYADYIENRLEYILENYEGEEQYLQLMYLSDEINDPMPLYWRMASEIISEVQEEGIVSESGEIYCIISDYHGCVEISDFDRIDRLRINIGRAIRPHLDEPPGG